MQKQIKAAAKKFGVDSSLIAAIIQVESGGLAFRTRFEDNFKHTTKDFQEHASRLGVTFMTEYVHQKTSWGLMQVMGATARDCGFKLHLPQLCLPEHGIYWGTHYFKIQLNRYARSVNQETDAIAAYNAGSARVDGSGRYRNFKYVQKVQHARKLFLNTNVLAEK